MNKISATILICALGLIPAALAAYDTHLDARAIHDAYVLGQRNDKATGDFLDAYAARITEPQNGPHIAQIELLTPYAQIVDDSRRQTASGYAEAQAAEDYKLRGHVVKVNIVIMLPAAYPKAAEATDARTPPPATAPEKSAMRPENFWQNFHFHLKQNGKSIASRSISNHPIYSTATSNAPAVLDGENVWLEFDVKDVAADLTAVEVVTPEGKTIKAAFDLKKLR
ncbi:MAG: hypothetical protein M3P45_05485 [Acidobacteriota bacterium]|nr:hypothetical protein [Acidobacteriota bacterium]